MAAVKSKIRTMFRTTKALVADEPESHAPFIRWLDKHALEKFVFTAPHEAKYTQLRNDSSAARKVCLTLISQDPYYERAAMYFVHLIRTAPDPPMNKGEREWIEKHYGVKLSCPLKKGQGMVR